MGNNNGGVGDPQAGLNNLNAALTGSDNTSRVTIGPQAAAAAGQGQQPTQNNQVINSSCLFLISKLALHAGLGTGQILADFVKRKKFKFFRYLEFQLQGQILQEFLAKVPKLHMLKAWVYCVLETENTT